MFEKDNRPFLVAGKDPDLNTKILLFLQSEGHNVVTAQDGREVLDILERNPDVKWTAFFLDVGIDGVETAKRIRLREMDQPVPTPLIFITGEPGRNHIPNLAGLAQGIVRRQPLDLQAILRFANLFSKLAEQV